MNTESVAPSKDERDHQGWPDWQAFGRHPCVIIPPAGETSGARLPAWLVSQLSRTQRRTLARLAGTEAVGPGDGLGDVFPSVFGF